MANFITSIFTKQQKNSTRKILLISSSITSVDNEIDTFDYFAAIASELAIKIQNRYKDVELVLKVPEGGGKTKDQQVRFIDEAINSHSAYECIVISPIDRDDLYPKMKSWITKYGANKIIFIDQGFTTDDYGNFHADDVARPPYVQADWREGGRVAAKSMLKYFKANNITCPHIVLVKGNIGSPQRISGFKEIMDGESSPTFQVSYHECNGNYSKKVARECFEPYLDNCINSNKSIDGIFATNDEMALGVRDALIKHKDNYVKKLNAVNGGKLPMVIGFDGIKDLTLLIDHKDDFIYDTVNVRLKEQLQCLAIIIDKIIINKGPITKDEKFVSMPCISYRELKQL